MRDRGIRKPWLQAAIAGGIAVAGGTAILWGMAQPGSGGTEASPGATAIGLGILPLLFGFLMCLNFLWAVRLVAKMRAGHGVIASWTVAPATFESFREAEKARKDRGNNWRIPRKTPAEGLPVIFSADAALVGDTFFGLGAKGMARFSGVRIDHGNPPSLAFDMVLTTAHSEPTMRISHHRSALRIPIAHDAHPAAAQVAGHFQEVLSGRRMLGKGFWRPRARIGTVVTLVAALCALAGYASSGDDGSISDFALALLAGGALTFAIVGPVTLLAIFLARRERARHQAHFE